MQHLKHASSCVALQFLTLSSLPSLSNCLTSMLQELNSTCCMAMQIPLVADACILFLLEHNTLSAQQLGHLCLHIDCTTALDTPHRALMQLMKLPWGPQTYEVLKTVFEEMWEHRQESCLIALNLIAPEAQQAPLSRLQVLHAYIHAVGLQCSCCQAVCCSILTCCWLRAIMYMLYQTCNRHAILIVVPPACSIQDAVPCLKKHLSCRCICLPGQATASVLLLAYSMVSHVQIIDLLSHLGYTFNQTQLTDVLSLECESFSMEFGTCPSIAQRFCVKLPPNDWQFPHNVLSAFTSLLQDMQVQVTSPETT